MEKKEMASGVEYVNANPQAQARVKTTPGAVAYVGLGFLEGVKALKVDDVAPSRQTIVSGTYPVARPLFMFTNGYPKLGSTAFKFCTFYLTEKGQELIESKKFVPLTNY
jgi:phosphate transport system substrate-binding protein